MLKVLALPLAGALLLAGCSSSSGDTSSAAAPGSSGSPATSELKVIADVYPVAWAAEQLGGPQVQVTTLTPPGVEPHDLELTASQVKDIASADLILYVPGMVPALDAAVAQQGGDRAVDVTAGLDRSGLSQDGAADPHVWLAPPNMTAVGDTIAKALAKAGATADPSEFDDAIDELTAAYASGLTDCQIKPMVVTHEAFGYLAHEYGFTQHGISGISPEAEPSPKRMREIAELVRSTGVSTIYTEPLVSDKAAKAIAAETGTTTAVLDPIESATNDQTYPELMTANLAALQTGQSCG